MSNLSIALCSDLSILKSPHRLRSSDVIIFPELVDGGYSSLLDGEKPHRLNDPLITELRLWTSRRSQYLIAGSLFLRNGQSPLNSSLVFHKGRLVYRYDKVHLFRPVGEHRFFSRGTRIGVFTIRSGSAAVRAGVVICYDLRFPELVRTMAAQGMRLLFVPARWPLLRDDAWCALLKARAIENQAFVIGCNAKGPEGGYSYAYDPFGKLLFNGRKRKQGSIERVILDLSRLSESRKLHNTIREAQLLRRLARS